MFPDTANFTDPAYTGADPGTDPLTGELPGDNPATPSWGILQPDNGLGVDPLTGELLSDNPAVPAWATGTVPSTGGAASNTPAQSNSTGASLFGWLNLAANVANTAVNGSRTGATSRPGVNKKPTSSLGSFGSVTTTTLLVIVAIFVGVVFLLKGK